MLIFIPSSCTTDYDYLDNKTSNGQVINDSSSEIHSIDFTRSDNNEENSTIVRMAGINETPNDITPASISASSPLNGHFSILGNKSELIGTPIFITQSNTVLVHFQITHSMCKHTNSTGKQHTLYVTNSMGYSKEIKIGSSYIFDDEVPIIRDKVNTITISLRP